MGFERLPETTADLAQERLARLRALFPECVTEGPGGPAVDFDLLRQSLSSEAVVEGPKERYRLEWPGKRAALYAANAPTASTLRPVRERSKDFDATRNLYVEGDNLEALKLLRTAYSGKVKLIYIDPPYNTGHDFIYHDAHNHSIHDERIAAGLLDDAGRLTEDKDPFRRNDETNGRYHSDWLTMMYPRLLLARDLLADDGVIFISIDDNEQANLKRLCDEIFGAGNFVACIPWQSRASIQNDTDFSINHEYVLVYARMRRQENRRLKESNEKQWFSRDSFVCRPLPLSKEKFENPDNDPRGAWKADPFDAPNIRPNLTYPIVNPLTGEQHLPPRGRHWRTEYVQFANALRENRIVFGKDGKGRPQLKVFYEEKKAFGSIDNSWLSAERVGTATSATKELQRLFDGVSYFDTPKPVRLLKWIIYLANTRNDDIVLDFFSGSGTTAHAVMQLNAEDGGKRQFILVQLPEKAELGSAAAEAGFADICAIGEERIRRAGEAILGERPELRGRLDVGFRVLRVDEKNELEAAQTPEDALSNWETALAEGTVKPGRTEEDLLFQALLRVAEPLLVERIERAEAAPGATVWSVAEGFLVACLTGEGALTAARAEAVTRWIVGQPVAPSYVVFREEGFADDTVKANVEAGLRQAGCRATLWVL